LFARPALVIERNDPLGRAAHVRHDEADARIQFARMPLKELPAAGGLSALCGCESMDDHESSSIITMFALWALLGVITLICWCRELRQRRAAIRWATHPLVDSADKGDGLESVQHGLRDADMDLEPVRLSSGGWRTFPSTDELKTYVDVLTGNALRQSNVRLLALVLAILVGVIGTLVILAVWFRTWRGEMI